MSITPKQRNAEKKKKKNTGMMYRKNCSYKDTPAPFWNRAL